MKTEAPPKALPGHVIQSIKNLSEAALTQSADASSQRWQVMMEDVETIRRSVEAENVTIAQIHEAIDEVEHDQLLNPIKREDLLVSVLASLFARP